MLKPCEAWAERLSAYLDGEYYAAERLAVEEHLAACPACRAFAELSRCDAQDAGAALQARGASDAFTARVMGQIAVTAITPVTDEVSTPTRHTPAQLPFYRRLIEWSVVVCAIAVVASILFPVFAKAREKSRQTTCLSQVRQLTTAMQIYLQDQGHYPQADHWTDALLALGGASKMFQCPEDRDKSAGHVSYLYNLALSGAKANSFPDLSDTIALWCSVNHKNGSVVGYADGNAKYLPNVWPNRQIATAVEMHDAHRMESPAMTANVPQIVESASAPMLDTNGLERPMGKVDAWRVITPKPPAAAPAPPTIAPPEKNYGLADKLQIAYKASLSLECTDVRASLERAELTFRRFDGFVLNSDYQKTDAHHAMATVSGRVPSEKLGTLLVELDALGTLQSRTVNGEDLTANQIEQFEKLGHLQGAQGRVTGIQNRAKANTALNAEDRMQSLGSEETGTRVDQYKLHSRVTLAEVAVTLASVPYAEPEKPAVNPLNDSAGRALFALCAFGTWLLTALLIPLLIWSPVWLPLGWLGLVLRRRYLLGGKK